MQINKKIALSVFAGLLILACAEKAPVYPWISDLDAKVETAGKIVGYEVYAKWWGACNRLDAETFIDPTLIAYSSENFVSYHVNSDSTEGQELWRRFNIRAIPTYVFVDDEGNEGRK